MTNAQITIKFFAAIDTKTKNEIIANIAKHYGITNDEALAEVTDDEAEHLLDYVTGPMRTAASVIMQRYG